MRQVWCDLEPFACTKNKVAVVHHEGEFSFENEKKLPCMYVRVARFMCAGRHSFFDDAEFGGSYKVPTITVGSFWTAPFVVFSGSSACDL
jgi:hypothetical protein